MTSMISHLSQISGHSGTRSTFTRQAFPIDWKTMPTKQPDHSSNEIEQQERQQLNAKIGDHVMRALGQPSDLHRLQVRRLWKDHYRVNILVGVDVVSAKVANSYFVVADGDGNIVRSNPKIAREYRPLPSALAVDKGNSPSPPTTT